VLVGSELLRSFLTEGAVWPVLVIIDSPAFNDPACLS